MTSYTLQGSLPGIASMAWNHMICALLIAGGPCWLAWRILCFVKHALSAIASHTLFGPSISIVCRNVRTTAL